MSWQPESCPGSDHPYVQMTPDGRLTVSVWPTDEVFETYLGWRESCEDVRVAYARWSRSEPWESRLAFAAYRAALDREECAARFHASCVEHRGALAK